MAVSSVLNPEAIIGGPKASPERFQNFITGGSPIGSSVVNSAANNIVGFQRSSVRPQFPDINNIINSINNNVDNSISNITNLTNRNIDSEINALRNELYAEIGKNKTSNITQLQTVVQNIQTQVNQTLQQSLNNFTKDYQDRVKQVDDAKPIGILGKFLSVYRTAIDFINFFGNKKNISRLRNNLDTLKTSFTETFEVAKLVRTVINKIVSQLSSLPTASPSGGGGLNIDVDVPGGGLKKTAPRGLGSMFKGKGKFLGLGLGALGLGVGGAAAVNALSDSGETQYSPISTDISGDSINRLQEIIQRFSFAIDSLLSGVGQSQKISVSSSGGGEPGKPESQDRSKNEPSKGVSTTGEQGVLDLIASVEQGPEGYDSFNISAGKTPGKATEKTIGWLSKNARGAIGRYQQMPQFLLERAQRAGFDENTKFTPEVQDAITLNELRSSHGMNEFLSGKITEEQFLQKLSPTWRGLPQGQINAARLGGTAEMTYQDQHAGRNAAGKKTYAQTISELKNIRSKGDTPIAQAQKTTATIAPDASKQQAVQQATQKVAQPPPSQQQGQVNIIPVDLGGQQQQSSGGGTLTPPPATKKSGPTVPILSSKNPDNFLVLYSRMVYNVVDG